MLELEGLGEARRGGVAGLRDDVDARAARLLAQLQAERHEDRGEALAPRHVVEADGHELRELVGPAVHDVGSGLGAEGGDDVLESGLLERHRDEGLALLGREDRRRGRGLLFGGRGLLAGGGLGAGVLRRGFVRRNLDHDRLLDGGGLFVRSGFRRFVGGALRFVRRGFVRGFVRMGGEVVDLEGEGLLGGRLEVRGVGDGLGDGLLGGLDVESGLLGGCGGRQQAGEAAEGKEGGSHVLDSCQGMTDWAETRSSSCE